jgi:hypothetical protein
VIETIAPVLVQTSRLFVFFHSSYPARDAATAALAFFLKAGYATWGSVRALPPVSMAKTPVPPPSEGAW